MIVVQENDKLYISKEQFYKQAHISKATALRLIQEGTVPVIDTGKRTKRYQILQSDADSYIQTYKRSLHEHQVKRGNLIQDIPSKYQVKTGKALQQAVKDLWRDLPGLLWLSDVVELLGYQPRTLRLWCKEKGLQHFMIENKICIPKKSLVKFVGSRPFHELPLKSEKHLNLLRRTVHE